MFCCSLVKFVCMSNYKLVYYLIKFMYEISVFYLVNIFENLSVGL